MNRSSYLQLLVLMSAVLWMVVDSSRFPARVASEPVIPEEIDRDSQLDSRPPSPILTINSEDRLKLRQSLLEVAKRRRVTATAATMSPDVMSTPSVYHFFSKKRFDRTRNGTRTTSTTKSPIPVTMPSKFNQKVDSDYGLV